MSNLTYEFDNHTIEIEEADEKEEIDETVLQRSLEEVTLKRSSHGIAESSQPSVKQHNIVGDDSMRVSLEKTENFDSEGQATYCPMLAWISNIFKLIFGRVGVMLGFLAALSYSGNSLSLKFLSQSMNSFQAVSLAMPVIIVGSSLVIIIKRPPMPKGLRQYLWLLFGGMSASMYMTFFTLSLSYLDVADAVSISYSSLMFVGVVSWIILREPVQLTYLLFSIIAFAGVVFISRPTILFRETDASLYENGELWIGVLLALGSALGIAFILTVFRKLSQIGIFIYMSILSGGIFTTATNAVICTAMGNWTVPTSRDWLLATAAGCCYFTAQTCIVVALTLESAPTINVMSSVEIVFSFIWQFVFLRVFPLWTSYVGATLLTVATLGITLCNQQTRQPNSYDLRRSVDHPMEQQRVDEG